MTYRLTSSRFLAVWLGCVIGLTANGCAQAASASDSSQTATLKFTVAGIVSTVNVVTLGVPNLDFQLATGGTCSTQSYALGATCTVNVTFTSQSPGLRMGAVVLRDSNHNALATTFISGIGSGSQLALVPGVITTVAGTGTAGFSGDSGPATGATLDQPYDVALDGANNLYINQGELVSVIRKVAAATGTISTVAGDTKGNFGYYGNMAPALGKSGGFPATDLILNGPIWAAVDGAGNLYINDYLNNVIRKVDAVSQIITTVVGSYPSPTNLVGANNPGGYGGDGGPATQPDGTPLKTAAPFSPQINGAVGLAFDGAGNLYLADKGNNVVRKVDAVTQIITTFAGNQSIAVPSLAGDGGPATSASLWHPSDVAVDAAGNVYIADANNQAIRKVDTTGKITTVAGKGVAGYSPDGTLGTSAMLNNPIGIVVDAGGNLYFSENGNNIIRELAAATGALTTVAGTHSATGSYTGDGGPAATATLNSPSGIGLDGAGNLYIADTANNVIRKVTPNPAH